MSQKPLTPDYQLLEQIEAVGPFQTGACFQCRKCTNGCPVAFAMDLFERGIISLKDTGGLDLAWGNGDAMETLIRQMAAGKGFGRILAKGVRRASQLIGNGAEHYAPHVKGLEMAGYHPDNMMGTALGYAVARSATPTT